MMTKLAKEHCLVKHFFDDEQLLRRTSRSRPNSGSIKTAWWRAGFEVVAYGQLSLARETSGLGGELGSHD